MSELDPDLKRLLKWGRKAEPPGPAEAPFGFSRRVLAAYRPTRDVTLLEELQQTAWGLGCVALALIVCGCLVLLHQRSGATSPADLPEAVSYLASNLPL